MSLGNKGMTLIEILIVLTLLAVVGTFVGINVLGSLDEGNVKAARTQISLFEAALEDFARDNGRYPSTEEGLEALVKNPGSLNSYRDGGYIKKLPKDPWGTEYDYKSDGNKYTITSYGKDRKEGGEKASADITN